MFELIILLVGLFIFGYLYYTSIVSRSKSIIEKMLDEKDEEN